MAVNDPELLIGREAKCICGRTVPSTEYERLAFFEFRGAGSQKATETCKHCHYTTVAHQDDAPVWPNGKTAVQTHGCPGFEPIGPWEFDSYYCGCRGWD